MLWLKVFHLTYNLYVSKLTQAMNTICMTVQQLLCERLLAGLLVLAYQNNGLEADITEKNGRHFSLDKIIKNAEQNPNLSLSLNTRKDMNLFRELGNYSAHKIWFNSTQKDIEPHILKYRAIIEELIYKAGLK